MWVIGSSSCYLQHKTQLSLDLWCQMTFRVLVCQSFSDTFTSYWLFVSSWIHGDHFHNQWRRGCSFLPPTYPPDGWQWCFFFLRTQDKPSRCFCPPLLVLGLFPKLDPISIKQILQMLAGDREDTSKTGCTPRRCLQLIFFQVLLMA